MSKRYIVEPARTSDERLYLLAWSVARLISYSRAGGSLTIDTANVTRRLILLAVAYRDSSGRERWGMVQLAAWGKGAPWSYLGTGWVTELDGAPTNAQIYRNLAGYCSATSLAEMPWYYERRERPGISAQFLDGAVCTNTWKAVTGEAPTLFFPNGK